MKREVTALQTLIHWHIVRLHDVFRDSDRVDLLFEYLDFDLFGLIRSRVLLPPHKKSLSRQLIEGVSFMHNKNFLHRDIKCELCAM